ncbi:U3 small nucleolar RNA-associated protein 6 OS=Schizosaccharomyces pombe (strain 972 / ATCC 24843) GN=utp6 PE=3 SV=1 [Rhizoctonia solani AG-1 IB]|uniref:U3 small nucleolar RNA-associated protein 6 n=1 Tax=Thanatephorus cucumeris (strain AG1-IB / isolate 7/3/14) TaxID=1108050 RepID=A0A0B7FXD0_THACB|nr:U3 small nucleolar RNA-associated protein 6 OS=Schizosaccharomyces pombe (strain 972 / ATCC 24843) GN=utp6 PE=3 SV=1 [Rhizoctonia solani AG-1 IB]
MERVHFYQEQMLPELKELEEKGLFSQSETRAILKQRTTFESALVRRVALKSDYIKYIQYEITLEALRKKRSSRLSTTDNKSSLADYCIVRRQFFILERAVRKFKSDVSLWVQYIELAKSNNARSLVGKLCSRALSLHPTSPSLYIIAASHELDSSLSPTGARALLQRGLRINPESVELWTEYIRMELGYCEGLRRRWKTLGIDPTKKTEEGQAIEAIISGAIVQAAISSATESLPTLALLVSLQTLLLSYPTELRSKLIEHLHSEFATRDTGLGPSGEDFRCGAVLLRATVDIPTRSLEGDVQLPSVPPLRPLIAAAFHNKTTPFPQEEQTGDFVKRMHKASKTLSSAGRTDLRVAELYARWVAAWTAVITENNLRLYLVLTLTALAASLCKDKHAPSSMPTLSTILRITLYLNKNTCTDEIQYRKLSQKFSKTCPEDAGLWIARLDSESGAAQPVDTDLSTYSPPSNIPEPIQKLWEEAREKAKEHVGEEDLLVKLWLWGVNHLPKNPSSSLRAETWTAILRGTLSHRSPTLHSKLLVHRLYDSENQSSGDRSALAKKLITQYRPSVLFFDLAMDQEFQKISALQPSQKAEDRERPAKRRKRSEHKPSSDSATQVDFGCLETLYTAWRIIPEQNNSAVLKYATLLYRLGDEERAEDTIRTVSGSKGSLRKEWEKARSGLELPVASADKTQEGVQSENDVVLDDVDFK